jgi:hypothetical protein
MEEAVKHHLDWAFIALLFCSGLLVYAKIVFPRRFMQCASLSRQFVKPLDPDYEKSRTGVFELITTVSYVLIAALLLMRLTYYLNYRISRADDWQVFFQLTLFIGIYLSLRNLSIKIVTNIFQLELAGNWWLDYLHYYRISVGIWLVPLMIFAYFFSAFQGFFLLIACLYLLFFLGRTIFNAMKEIHLKRHISLMRIILYLCSLEIAPLLWLLFWFFEV